MEHKLLRHLKPQKIIKDFEYNHLHKEQEFRTHNIRL